MKIKTKLFMLTLFALVITTVNIPISKSNISGRYVNNNFDKASFYAEIPYQIDTLILFQNGSFKSNYYGKGNYEIQSGVFTNTIELPTHQLRVKNKILQSTKIILVYDLDFYYEKID